jgi:hypothetical protein
MAVVTLGGLAAKFVGGGMRWGPLTERATTAKIIRYHVVGDNLTMDEDLDDLDRETLIAEVKRLRAGIRAHRDSSGHDLCWHHPRLWQLLPEPLDPDIAVPPWPQFLRGCVHYRESLDQELPDAPEHHQEFKP